MSKLLKILFSIIIIIATFNIGEAENESLDFHGIPSYTIETYLNNRNVNKGDIASFNVFISGVGDVDANKFLISIPPYIIKGNVVLKDYSFEGMKPSSPKYSVLENFISVNLPDEYFQLARPPLLSPAGEIQINNSNGSIDSPITLNFKVDDNAPDGDHEIYFSLYYKNGTQWYNSQKMVMIHVNSWEEQHPYQQAGIIASIGAIVVAIASFIWNRVAKWVNRPKERIKDSELEHFHNGHWHPISRKHED